MQLYFYMVLFYMYTYNIASIVDHKRFSTQINTESFVKHLQPFISWIIEFK